jgi:hypothetical protein
VGLRIEVAARVVGHDAAMGFHVLQKMVVTVRNNQRRGHARGAAQRERDVVVIAVESIIRSWTLEKHPQLAATHELPLVASLQALHHLVFSTRRHRLSSRCVRRSLRPRGRRARGGTKKGSGVKCHDALWKWVALLEMPIRNNQRIYCL